MSPNSHYIAYYKPDQYLLQCLIRSRGGDIQSESVFSLLNGETNLINQVLGSCF